MSLKSRTIKQANIYLRFLQQEMEEVTKLLQTVSGKEGVEALAIRLAEMCMTPPLRRKDYTEEHRDPIKYENDRDWTRHTTDKLQETLMLCDKCLEMKPENWGEREFEIIRIRKRRIEQELAGRGEPGTNLE